MQEYLEDLEVKEIGFDVIAIAAGSNLCNPDYIQGVNDMANAIIGRLIAKDEEAKERRRRWDAEQAAKRAAEQAAAEEA